MVRTALICNGWVSPTTAPCKCIHFWWGLVNPVGTMKQSLHSLIQLHTKQEHTNHQSTSHVAPPRVVYNRLHPVSQSRLFTHFCLEFPCPHPLLLPSASLLHCSLSPLPCPGFVYNREGGILDNTHPPNFGPTQDPPPSCHSVGSIFWKPNCAVALLLFLLLVLAGCVSPVTP